MLAIKYAFFATIATGVNLATQKLTFMVMENRYALLVALMLGTLAGLVAKYLLDKRYIFRFKTTSVQEDSRIFLLYSLVGVVTTAIFWGFEITFAVLFENENALYLGGAIGLAIGYVCKYQLDKRYVFIATPSNSL